MKRASGVPSAAQQRAANLRMVALASAVALAIVLPLAVATAGPTGLMRPEKAQGKPRGAVGERPGAAVALPDEPGASPSPARAADPGPRRSVRCGPELTSPEGVEAQTCVLEQGTDTWARTYYRNATGGPVTAVLTLMGPDGRTVEVHCRTDASDEPGGCETPRERTTRAPEHGRERAQGRAPVGEGGQEAYTAVAEIASPEGDLLLRSGSNSPGDRAD
ncbi:hypothetical protein GCM10009544_67280 [Streptomyces stramineus]|uniref:Uncharacterized protein n=1 Tax=Streptomyces stramineus TaxID=173861 RepID=A0ABP3LFT0_9ACTN